jgi:hypothetical protein
MRHVGFGSRPISNPAWLSTDDPVVNEPESAKGISGRNHIVSERDKKRLSHGLTHTRQALRHNNIPLGMGKDAHILPESPPFANGL